MDKAIVITTINPPRKEIFKFSKIPGWKLISVGDLKTPKDWHVENVDYLSPELQDKLFPKFSKVFPWKMYARKNFGYLYAMKQGAKVICDTDDDMFPDNNFPPPLGTKKNAIVLKGKKFIEVYRYFLKKKTSPLIWARGFPLEFIKEQTGIKQKKEVVFSPIQNSVIDKDSDFDAIYRLLFNNWLQLKKKGAYALEKGCYGPVNSQNTFTYHEVFPLLYLPATPGFHVEDIYRGYIAQRILWEIGGKMLFIHPTGYTSNRNPHNYLSDFKLEVPMFLKTKTLIDILDSLSLSENIAGSLLKVYTKLVKEEFFPKEELKIVTAWINEIERL